jgi:glucose/arabinose dehydrogenase
MKRLPLGIAVALLVVLTAAAAADGKSRLKLNRIGTFSQPTYVASAPGVNGVFVVERGGRIVLVQGRKRRTFTKIGNVSTGGERGLLSVAFAPDYERSRLAYVYFTNGAGDIEIAQLQANPSGTRAPASTLRRLLLVPHPRFDNHNGGQVEFGPDGFLYAGTGDGGGGGDDPDNAQNPDSLLGKLLRIDPATGAVTVHARGLRNPYRFSFDRTGDPSNPRLVIGDVGQDRFEEIDYLPFSSVNGANFGWNDFEGFEPFPGAHPPTAAGTVRPIKVYALDGGACALIGGYVVRDQRLRPLLRRYVYGDFCTGKIRSLIPRLGGARKDRGTGLLVSSLSSFGEGPGGSLFATSLEGPVYRIVARRK